MASASIIARLGLDSAGFQGGLKGALGQLRGFAGQFTAFLGAASLTAVTESVISLGKEIRNLSDLSGMSAEEFQKSAFAAKTVGIEQDKLADIFKDVNDKVGDFLTTGAGPMADFFEKIAPQVGVTAEQFRGLSGKEALQLYVDTLQKANVNQQEMTFFMEAIASDSSMLTPLLRDNGAAFNELGNEAERTGAVISNENVKALNQLSDKLETSKKKFLVALAPAIIFAVVQVQRFIKFIQQTGYLIGTSIVTIQDFGDVITTVFKPVTSIFENAMMAVKAFYQAITGDLDAAMETIRNVKSFDDIIEEFKRMPEEAEKSFERFKQSAEDNFNVAGQEMLKLEDEFKSFEKSLKKVESQSEETALAVSGVAGAPGNADKAAKARQIIEEGLADIERKRLPANEQLKAIKEEQAAIEEKINAGAEDSDKLAREFLSLQRERLNLEKQIAGEQERAHEERMKQLEEETKAELDKKKAAIDEKLAKEQSKFQGRAGGQNYMQVRGQLSKKERDMVDSGKVDLSKYRQDGENNADTLARLKREALAKQAEQAKQQLEKDAQAKLDAERAKGPAGSNENPDAAGTPGSSPTDPARGEEGSTEDKAAQEQEKQEQFAEYFEQIQTTAEAIQAAAEKNAETVSMIHETLKKLDAALK